MSEWVYCQSDGGTMLHYPEDEAVSMGKRYVLALCGAKLRGEKWLPVKYLTYSAKQHTARCNDCQVAQRALGKGAGSVSRTRRREGRTPKKSRTRRGNLISKLAWRERPWGLYRKRRRDVEVDRLESDIPE